MLMDYSRDANVMLLLSQRIKECFDYLNTSIFLPQRNRLLFYLLSVNRLHL